MARGDINLDETDLVKRIHRLEELVLSGRTPEPVDGESIESVLKGDGTEEPSFKRVDAEEAAVDGSEVVTQADGVAQHNLADPAVHGDAADFIDQDALSIRAASFATASDVPTPLATGTIVHIEDENELYQQKASGFEKVSPTRDIAFKDRAETFEESDVTLNTGNGAKLTNESIGLVGPQTEGRYQYATGNFHSEVGMRFTLNESADWVELETYAATDGDSWEVRNSDGTTTLQSGTLEGSGGETFRTDPLDAGTYRVVVFDSSGSLNYGKTKSYSWGFSLGPKGQLDGGVRDGVFDTDRVYGIHFITLPGYKSGSATVEWPTPNDIYRWDAATFTTTEDGETVGVYVEESADGGSTWTEIDGPINRGDMITAAAGSEVRFRIELSRTDTANNPTLDSIYRRYVV